MKAMSLQVTSAIVALLWASAAPAGQLAGECPRPGTLGTSRVLAVEAKTTPRVGLKSFAQTLPLEDHEVVLTLDDGPRSPMTDRLLNTLADQCARATFFIVGRSALERKATVQRMAAEGHTIGHHSLGHQNLSRIAFDKAIDEIDRGIANDEMALKGRSTSVPSTPFFRFPYFASTPALLDRLQSRDIVVFGADLWASDWNPMTPEQEYNLITRRLNAAHKGIILFHDPQPRTVAMLPAFLRYLRDNHYRVVHIVPQTASGATVTGVP